MRTYRKHRYNSSIFHPAVPKYRTTYNQKRGLVIRQRPREENQIRKTDADYAKEIEWMIKNNLILMPPTDTIINVREIGIHTLFPVPEEITTYTITYSKDEFYDHMISSTHFDEQIPQGYSVEFHLMSIFLQILPNTNPFTNYDQGTLNLVNSGGWMVEGAMQLYDFRNISNFPSRNSAFQTSVKPLDYNSISMLGYSKESQTNNLTSVDLYSDIPSAYWPIGTYSAGILPMISTGNDLVPLPSQALAYTYAPGAMRDNEDSWNWRFMFKVLVHFVKEN